MDLRKYQEAVMNGSICVDEKDRFIESTLGLCGEAGEFADQVKKKIRESGLDLWDGRGTADRMGNMVEELGDLLWYLTSVAGQLGFSLDELASFNYNKLSERHPDRYPRVVE